MTDQQKTQITEFAQNRNATDAEQQALAKELGITVEELKRAVIDARMAFWRNEYNGDSETPKPKPTSTPRECTQDEKQGIINEAVKVLVDKYLADPRRSYWASALKVSLDDLDALVEKARRESVIEITTAAALKLPDMPESVLDGRLGEWTKERLGDFCLAYAWPAMLGTASALVLPKESVRTNLYECLVGPAHSGKSEVGKRTSFLFNLKLLSALSTMKYGSAEGMLEDLAARQGCELPILWAPDELSHTLEKAQIQNASFPYVLNTFFYENENGLTVQGRKKITATASLSILGGLVTENFENSFGAATTTGLYDRFLFGLCPTGWMYEFRPLEGPPLFDADFGGTGTGFKLKIAPSIERSVYDAMHDLIKGEGIDHRIVEIAIRVATVVAAWDGREILRASELRPAFELARYQQRLRELLKPNPGRNFEAIAAFKILNFLKQHRDGKKWIDWRDVHRATRIMEFGPMIADRARDGLVFAREIEKMKIKPSKGGRERIVVRLWEPEEPIGSSNL